MYKFLAALLLSLVALAAPAEAKRDGVRIQAEPLWTNHVLGASGSVTSSAVLILPQSEAQALFFRGVKSGGQPNYKLEVLTTLDQAESSNPTAAGYARFAYPASSTVGTFTTDQWQHKALTLPVSTSFIVVVTNLDSGAGVTITVLAGSQ